MKNNFSKKALIIIEICLFAYAFSLILPYLWVLLNSFKDLREFYTSIWQLPSVMRVENYVKALKETNMLSYFKNSILISTVGTAMQVFFSACTAYVLAKYKFRGRNIVFACAVSGLLLPVSGTIAPFYKFMSDFNLFNIPGLLLTYASGMSQNMIILYAFFKNIPWSFAEAAYIDGASHFTVFRKIMLPMAKGPMIAVSIISFISIWNDYFIPSILLTVPKQQTVAVGLYSLYVQQQYAAAWTVLFAAVIVASLPTIVVYGIFSDRINKGFLMGGLKG